MSEDKVCEKRVCINLCELQAEAEVEKILQRTKPKPKKIEKKAKKQVKKKKPEKIQKKKIKPETITIPIVKKIEEPKIEKVEIEKKEIVESIILVKETNVVEEITKKKTVQKSQEDLDKEKQLKQEQVTKEYVEINTQKIAKLLRDNLYYPRSARKRGVTGKVIVKFTLSTNSKVSDVVVLESKSDILSRAATKTIQNLSGEFPKPNQEITLHVPIGYSLR